MILVWEWCGYNCLHQCSIKHEDLIFLKDWILVIWLGEDYLSGVSYLYNVWKSSWKFESSAASASCCSSIMKKTLFRELNVDWNHPGSCNALFCEISNFFGGKKRGMILGRCVVVAVFVLYLLFGLGFGWRGSI